MNKKKNVGEVIEGIKVNGLEAKAMKLLTEFGLGNIQLVKNFDKTMENITNEAKNKGLVKEEKKVKKEEKKIEKVEEKVEKKKVVKKATTTTYTYPTMGSIKYEIVKLKDLKVSDLIAIKKIMKTHLGFEKKTYEGIIGNVETFVIARKRNYLNQVSIVGISAIKIPKKDYKDDIFMSADRSKTGVSYDRELGYIWVDFLSRRRGVALKMVNMLLNEKDYKGRLFSTVKHDNVGSIKLLGKVGLALSVSLRGIENFVNHKSGNVLKLMYLKKDKKTK